MKTKEWIVRVTYVGDPDLYDDIDEDGHVSEGDYSYTGADEDEVLDKFHDSIPMGNLELYELEVKENK